MAFILPIFIHAWAVIVFGGGAEFDKTAALGTDAVFQAVALFADIKAVVIHLVRGFYVLGHNGNKVADLFIKTVDVDICQKAFFAKRF